jgi:hypothetical protein
VKELLDAFISMDCLLIVDGKYYRLQASDSLLLSTREQCGQTTGSINDLFLAKVIDADICAGYLRGNVTDL